MSFVPGTGDGVLVRRHPKDMPMSGMSLVPRHYRDAVQDTRVSSLCRPNSHLSTTYSATLYLSHS